VFDVYNCATLCTTAVVASSDGRSSMCMSIRLSFATVSVRLSYNFALVLVSLWVLWFRRFLCFLVFIFILFADVMTIKY